MLNRNLLKWCFMLQTLLYLADINTIQVLCVSPDFQFFPSLPLLWLSPGKPFYLYFCLCGHVAIREAVLVKKWWFLISDVTTNHYPLWPTNTQVGGCLNSFWFFSFCLICVIQSRWMSPVELQPFLLLPYMNFDRNLSSQLQIPSTPNTLDWTPCDKK